MSDGSVRSLIAAKFPNEDPADVETMIAILAEERAKVVGFSPVKAAHTFAAAILCLILDPVKSEAYVRGVEEFRRSFRGIAMSTSIQQVFRGALRPELLHAEDAAAAIRMGHHQLLRVPALL